MLHGFISPEKNELNNANVNKAYISVFHVSIKFMCMNTSVIEHSITNIYYFFFLDLFSRFYYFIHRYAQQCDEKPEMKLHSKRNIFQIK